jgi:hypothetical protein
MIAKMELLKNSFIGASKANHRMAPIGIMLSGGPGVGKSKLLTYLCELMSRVKNRTFNPDMVYTRVLDSEYFEEYNPLSQPIIHYSELGNKSKKMAASQGDSVINELCSVMDSLAYSCNMPFDRKGTVYALPEMVICDTNNPELNLKTLVSNPAAVRRRFLYIDVRVKPEFVKKAGCEMDPQKSMEKGGDMMDRWLFTVYKYSAVSATESNKVELATLVDIYEMSKLMVSLMRDHIRREEEMLSKVNSRQLFEFALNKSFESDMKLDDLLDEEFDEKQLGPVSVESFEMVKKPFVYAKQKIVGFFDRRVQNMKNDIRVIGGGAVNLIVAVFQFILATTIDCCCIDMNETSVFDFSLKRFVFLAFFGVLYCIGAFHVMLLSMIVCMMFFNPKYVAGLVMRESQALMRRKRMWFICGLL